MVGAAGAYRRCHVPPRRRCHVPPRRRCHVPPRRRCHVPPRRRCHVPPRRRCHVPPRRRCHVPPRRRCHVPPRRRCLTLPGPGLPRQGRGLPWLVQGGQVSTAERSLPLTHRSRSRMLRAFTMTYAHHSGGQRG